MATSSQWYAQAGGILISRYWVPQNMSVALLKSTYVPDLSNHLRYSDVSPQEVAAGGGYTVGGKALTGKSTSYDGVAHEMNLLAADLSWGPGATFQTRYGVIYEQVFGLKRAEIIEALEQAIEVERRHVITA